jgi:hypothetical protein
MKGTLTLLMICLLTLAARSQKLSIAQMKSGLEAAPNPLQYCRDVLHKNFKLDTIVIANSSHFSGYPDSLAYHGKVRKVYGPVDKKFLVQILEKLPNNFYHISQIFLDTTVFTRKIADSIGSSIVKRIREGSASFEDLAQGFSMGGEGATKGDLGWLAHGAMQPEIEKEIVRHKPGEVFRMWSRQGLHIIKKNGEPRKDTGFVLMLRVIL